MHKRITASSKFISVICLLIVGVLSVTVLSPLFSSTKFHAASIEKIDDKKMNAMNMSAAVTAASVAISAIPDDVGSSVADELDDLTAVLFIIVCVLYLEKYLLTIMSYISFSFFVPAVCFLFAVNLFTNKETLKIWATRLLVLTVVVASIIPVSVKVTSILDETFSESIHQTLDAVYRIVEDDSEKEENTNAFVRFIESVKETVSDVVEAAKKMLSLFVDAVAVLVVTSCLIPLLTIFVFIWSIKTIFRTPMDVTKTLKSAHTLMKKQLIKQKASFYLEESEDHIAS